MSETESDTIMTVTTTSARLDEAIADFSVPPGYLAAAAMGLPSKSTIAAQRTDLDRWQSAQLDPLHYMGVVERTRAHYARLVGVRADRVAIGSQTSVITSIAAAAVPVGAEVLSVEGDFSSIVFPFLQRSTDRGGAIRVRTVSLAELAGSITDDTWLVVFSHIQSATGQVADVESILREAAKHGAYTFCDTTQSAGVHPVDAALFDFTVCHSYKWLCSPRGVAFLTVSERFQTELAPLHAGWYAGDDVWGSCYGPNMTLATDARAFDVSPAWPTWAGAEPAIEMFAKLDISEVWRHAVTLGNSLCESIGIEPQQQAIVTWIDSDAADLAQLVAHGIVASGRAGRIRVAFHLWNTEADVAAVVTALH